MKSLLEDALRREIARREQPTEWRPRPDLVFHGGGLTEEAQGMTMAEIIEMSYEK